MYEFSNESLDELTQMDFKKYFKSSKKKAIYTILIGGSSILLLEMILIVLLFQTNSFTSVSGLSSINEQIDFVNNFQFIIDQILLIFCLVFSIIMIFRSIKRGSEDKGFWIGTSLIYFAWIVNLLVGRFTRNFSYWNEDTVVLSTNIFFQKFLEILILLFIIIFFIFQIRKMRILRNNKKSRRIKKRYILLLLIIVICITIPSFLGLYQSNSFSSEYPFFYETVSYIENGPFVLDYIQSLYYLDPSTSSYFRYRYDGSACAVILVCLNSLFFVAILSIIYNAKDRSNDFKTLFSIVIASTIILKLVAGTIVGYVIRNELQVDLVVYLYPFSTFNLVTSLLIPMIHLCYQKRKDIILKDLKLHDSEIKKLKERYIETIIDIKTVYKKISFRRLSQLLDYSLDMKIEDWLVKNVNQHIETITERDVIFKQDNLDEDSN